MKILLIVAAVVLGLALCFLILFIYVLSKLLEVSPLYLAVGSFIKYRILFDKNGIVVKAGALHIWKTLYPKKPNLKKIAKELKKKKGAAPTQSVLSQVGSGIGVGNYKEMLSLLTDLVKEVLLPTVAKLKNKIRLKVKKLKVEVGTEDAAKTALIYGAVSAGTTGLMELLQNTVKLSFGNEKEIGVFCRFDRKETLCEGELLLKLTPYEIVRIFLPALIKYLMIKQSIKERNDHNHV